MKMGPGVVRPIVLALVVATLDPIAFRADAAPAGVASPVAPRERRSPALVWTAAEAGGSLVEVNTATGRVLRRRPTDGGPHNMTVGPSGTVVAGLYASNRIAIVRDGRLSTVTLGGRPHDVKIAGGTIVVANEGAGRLDLVSPAGRPMGRIALAANPHDLAIAPGGRIAWVTLDGDDRLAAVNLRTRSVRYVATGRSPHDLLFSPDARLFVTDWNGALYVFSRSGVELDGRSLGREAHHLAFTPDGGEVWITDNSLQVIFVLDAQTLQIVARLRTPGAPHHITVTTDGRLAVVADNTHGSLLIYRVSTRRLVRTIQVGAGAHGVWAAP
jgi:DNA-binding beta-propeller fold protein YncE